MLQALYYTKCYFLRLSYYSLSTHFYLPKSKVFLVFLMKTKSQTFLSRLWWVDYGFFYWVPHWNKHLFFNIWALNIILVGIIDRIHLGILFLPTDFYISYTVKWIFFKYLFFKKEHLFTYQWLSIVDDLTLNADLEVEPLISKGK